MKLKTVLGVTTRWSLILFLGCFFMNSADAANQTGTFPLRGQDNILRMGVDASGIGTFDPHYSASHQDRAAADMLFNGLVRYKPGEAPEIEPDLVESIPEPVLVDDRQVWVFKLRKGVMFHPGPAMPSYEMTADDVVYSIKKSSDPRRSGYAGEYENMTVEKMSDYTVRITLSKPLSPVLFLPKISNYAGGFIVSKRALEKMGDDEFARHPVGTGPFMLAEYRPTEKACFMANPHYFRGRPNLDGVAFYFMPEDDQRNESFLNGGLDVMRGFVTEKFIAKMSQMDGILVDRHGVGEVAIVHFNTGMKPFDDRRVRRAVAYAIDRNQYLDTIVRKNENNVYSPVPADLLPGGLNRNEVEALDLDYRFNPAKAKALLTEAGYPNGFSLQVVSSNLAAYLKVYRCLKRQLARVDIDLKIDVVDHSTMHALVRQGAYPLLIYIAWRPNADAYLTQFFHSGSIAASGSARDTNFSHYASVDHLIEDARWETSSVRQIKLWKLAQIKILSDMAAYPLVSGNLIHVRRHYVDYGHPLKASMALYPQITEKSALKFRIQPR